MLNKDRIIGAIVAIGFLLLGFRAYQDDKAVWDIVKLIQTAQAQQAQAQSHAQVVSPPPTK